MKRILLVEDEVDIRDPFTIVLRSKGYRVDAAVSGEEAVRYQAENTYDLVLLDLMMPDLDGIGFLKQAYPQGIPASTRIILLTNLSSGELLKQGMALGAHRHKIKSDLTPSSLIDLVESELGKNETAS